jgi:hypothetical protein
MTMSDILSVIEQKFLKLLKGPSLKGGNGEWYSTDSKICMQSEKA